jgi:hypothetical protein
LPRLVGRSVKRGMIRATLARTALLSKLKAEESAACMVDR